MNSQKLMVSRRGLFKDWSEQASIEVGEPGMQTKWQWLVEDS